MSKPVVRILHDGFPLESFPAKGRVTLVHDDGTLTQQTGYYSREQYFELHRSLGLSAVVAAQDFQKNYVQSE